MSFSFETASAKINVSSPNYTLPYIHAKQGDKLSRKVKLSLCTDDGGFYPPKTATYLVRCRKPNKKTYVYDKDETGAKAVTVSNNVLTVALIEQILNVPGKVLVDILIMDDETHLATFNFIIEVEENPLYNGIPENFISFDFDSVYTDALDGTNTTQVFKLWWPLTANNGLTKYDRLNHWFEILANAYDGKKYTLKYALVTSSDSTMTPMDDLVGKTAAPVVTDASTDVNDWTEEDCMTWYVRANALSLADGTMNVTYIEGEDGFDITGETAPVYTFSLALWLREWGDDNGNYKSWTTTALEGYWPYEGDISPTNVKRVMTWHPTFCGGLTSDGKLTSGSGLAPAIKISAVNGLAKAKLWNTYEGLWNDCDAKWLLDMWQLRHFNLENSNILEGCASYHVDATVAVAETGTNRVLIPADNFSTFVVGSTVCLSSVLRGGITIFWNKRISSIETVTIDGISYTAVNIETDGTFDTTVDYHLATLPWFSGSTEALPGHSDGSIGSATNGKYTARVAGVEVLNGAHTVSIEPLWNATANATSGMNCEAYYCRDSTKLAGALTNYTASGIEFTSATTGWQYIKAFFVTKLGILLPSAFGGGAFGWYKSSFYISPSGGVCTPWRYGDLRDGSRAGLAYAVNYSSPTHPDWNGAPRLGGSGKMRGEWTE